MSKFNVEQQDGRTLDLRGSGGQVVAWVSGFFGRRREQPAQAYDPALWVPSGIAASHVGVTEDILAGLGMRAMRLGDLLLYWREDVAREAAKRVVSMGYVPDTGSAGHIVSDRKSPGNPIVAGKTVDQGGPAVTEEVAMRRSPWGVRRT